MDFGVSTLEDYKFDLDWSDDDLCLAEGRVSILLSRSKSHWVGSVPVCNMKGLPIDIPSKPKSL